MPATFNFLPQSVAIEGLLNACVAALPRLPGPEKEVLISALREFEKFTAPTMWSAEDVDDDLGLTDEERINCISRFSENYECTEADWYAIAHVANQIVQER